MKKVLLLGLLGALLVTALPTGTALAAEESKDLLIGTWHLSSLDDGTGKGAPHYADCTGEATFSANGHMTVQVMFRDPKTPDTQYAKSGYEASFGKYTVDAEGKVFTYRADGALARGLMGQELKRVFTISDDKLTITSIDPNEHWKAVWARD